MSKSNTNKRNGASHRRGLAGRLMFVFAVLFLPMEILFQAAAIGTEQENVPRQPISVQYRRWLAPRDRLEDWPFGKHRYVPIKPGLFEQWIEALKRSDVDRKETAPDGLARIVLHARLEGRQLVDGRGFLEFPSTLLKENAVSRSFVLEPWGIWIGSPLWEGGGSAAIVRGADGETRLILSAPGKTDTNISSNPFERNTGLVSDRDRETDGQTANRVRFDWSLRSRTDAQGRLQFDFELPSSTGFELNLQLPDFMVPSTSNGIVMKSPNSDETSPSPGLRRWRILWGRQSKTTLVLSAAEDIVATQQKTAVRQSLVYNIAPQGTEVTAKIYFDRSDAFVNELILDLESPLRPVEIRYGDKILPWTSSVSKNSETETDASKGSASEDGEASTRLHINLAEVGKSELRELSLVSLMPASITDHRIRRSSDPRRKTESEVSDRPDENAAWYLPRIRVVSPNVFWQETRCGVIVRSPLLARSLECAQAVQVSPLAVSERGVREVFAFQFFRADARVSLDLAYHVPRVIADSSLQIHWGASEITGNMVVDCKVEEGDCFTLEFPVLSHWTINSVISSFGADDILFWDIVRPTENPATGTDDEKDHEHSKKQLLVIQLKRPLRSKQSIRFEIVGRFLPPPREEFRFADLALLDISQRKGAEHFIAVRPDPPFHIQYTSLVPEASEIRDPLDSRLARRFVNPPVGNVFPLDARTREIRFRMDQLKPDYSSEILGTVYLKENEWTASYRISCRPIDSPVDRILVFFTVPLSAEQNERNSGKTKSASDDSPWRWTANSESIRPLQVRRLTDSEREELLPSTRSPASFHESREGEIWEVRPAVPQTNPFEIQVESTVKFQKERSVIPLAALPATLSQKGEIRIESSRSFPYRIVNNRLKSVPVATTDWSAYRKTRAAFRYDPADELRSHALPSLLLKKVAPDEGPPSAWAWSLRLDSQYESEGTVKNNAVFLLENRGKESLRIDLPDGIRIEDVHAVWLDDARVTWHPDEKSNENRENADEKAPDGKKTDEKFELARNSVVVSLPEGKRFVSVSLEYSYRDVPLTRHRKLNPRYPTADVPVLAGNWTSWFPPEFEVGDRDRVSRSPRRSDIQPSKALGFFLTDVRFDPFSTKSWKTAYYGKRDREDSVRASRVFLRWMAATLSASQDHGDLGDHSNESRRTDSSVVAPVSLPQDMRRSNTPTWGDLLSREDLLIEMLDQNEEERRESQSRRSKRTSPGTDSRVEILVDAQSFAHFGISPEMPVSLPASFHSGSNGSEVLDRNGLVLIVSRNENGYVFYITSFLMTAVHHHFETLPVGNFVRYLPDSSVLPSSDPDKSSERAYPTSTLGDPRWVPVDQWIKQPQTVSFPWSISSQIIRLASVTPDWIAYEFPQVGDDSLYIVHRNTFAAYHWLAFLTVIVLTWKKPLSSPVFLVFLMILFEIWARFSVACHLGIPAGAFLGAVVSLGFCFIRPRWKMDDRLRIRTAQSSSASRAVHLPLVSDEDSDMEISGEEQGLTDDSKSVDPQDDPTAPSLKAEAFFNRFSFEAPSVETTEKPAETADDSDADDSSGSGGGSFRTSIFLISMILALSGSDLSAETPTVKSSPGYSVVVSEGPEDKTVDRSKREFSRKESVSENRKDSGELYRIFFPIDESHEIVDEHVWIPVDFLELLYGQTRDVPGDISDRWSIRSARYEGTLTYNPLSQGLSLAAFKATYELDLDEEDATIILPALPLVQDGAMWNAAPIQPTWRFMERRDGTTVEERENGVLIFNVEGRKKGRHILELSLDPKLVRSEETRRVSIRIPKVPDTTLRLNAPPDAPTIHVADCCGASTSNTIIAPTLNAEIGPSERLTFYWMDEPTRGDAATVEIDSMLWLQAKPTQVDIRTKFRYRIEGGKVRHVNLATDPHWQLSGQFHCEEHPIENVETYYETFGSDKSSLPRGEVTRLVFKTPVSGTLTVRAGFVLKEFSGIGRIRLPQFRPLHARSVKSMLAVSADPLLELDLPRDGLGTGFLPGWFGTPSSTIGSETRPTPSETVSSTTTAVPEERILAEYDLSKTPSSWVLPIRMKGTPPDLKSTQSFAFDYGDSHFQAVGEFSPSGEILQQSFFVSEFLRIESIEVFDLQNNPVETRTAENAVVPVPSGEIVRKRTIFFKRALSGKFRIVVSGYFSSRPDRLEHRDSSLSDDLESILSKESVFERVPCFAFDHVVLEELRLDFYRKPTVLIDIRPDPSHWKPAEFAPVAPEVFSNVQFLGSWILSRNRGSESGRDVKSWLDLRPTLVLSPNKPVIRSEMISTLSRVEQADSWIVTFDVLWDVTQGEMDSARFQWDERCGAILSVEPPIPWALEQKNGRSQLTLTSRTPWSGKRHFRIKAAVNTTGATLSLPGLVPVPDRTSRLESKTYVILPRESESVQIPWNLSALTAVEESTIGYLTEQTTKNLGGEKSDTSSVSAPLWDESRANAESRPVSPPATDREPRMFLQATTDEYIASITPESSRSTALLFDVGLFVKRNGELFGIAMFDLKAQGHDSFTLTMPPRYELIQIASAGIVSEGTRLTDRRWKIDLCSSDYPQRIGIVFRGVVESTEGSDFENGEKKIPFSFDRMQRERIATSISLPVLDNVDVMETLWTLSFETTPASNGPVLGVSTVYEEPSDLGDFPIPFTKRDIVESLGRHTPVAGQEAAQTLLKLELVRLDNLLFILDSIQTPSPSKVSEVERWYSQWTNEWFGILQMVDFHTVLFPTVLHSDEHSVLFGPMERRTESVSGRSIGTFIESMRVPELTLQALQVRQDRLREKLGFDPSENASRRSSSFSAGALVHCRGLMTEEASHLFGATEGQLKELRIVSYPGSGRWAERLVNPSWLWLLLPAVLLIFSRKLRLEELFMQFPHFWGTLVGLILWSLFPPGYFGMLVLSFVFLSLFFSPWPRRRISIDDENI